MFKLFVASVERLQPSQMMTFNIPSQKWYTSLVHMYYSLKHMVIMWFYHCFSPSATRMAKPKQKLPLAGCCGRGRHGRASKTISSPQRNHTVFFSPYSGHGIGMWFFKQLNLGVLISTFNQVIPLRFAVLCYLIQIPHIPDANLKNLAPDDYC